MEKFAKYTVDLKNLSSVVTEFHYHLDDAFFKALEETEVQRGDVSVCLCVKKTIGAFELQFQLEGAVIVLCDRCLDEMEQPISTVDTLFAKFGPEYAEEGENLVIVPEEEGTVNVAWFMYEFIALAIPLKHVHASGKCNLEMMGKLETMLRTEADGDDLDLPETIGEDHPIDPRWNDLKKILDNN